MLSLLFLPLLATFLSCAPVMAGVHNVAVAVVRSLSRLHLPQTFRFHEVLCWFKYAGESPAIKDQVATLS